MLCSLQFLTYYCLLTSLLWLWGAALSGTQRRYPMQGNIILLLFLFTLQSLILPIHKWVTILSFRAGNCPSPASTNRDQWVKFYRKERREKRSHHLAYRSVSLSKIYPAVLSTPSSKPVFQIFPTQQQWRVSHTASPMIGSLSRLERGHRAHSTFRNPAVHFQSLSTSALPPVLSVLSPCVSVPMSLCFIYTTHVCC